MPFSNRISNNIRKRAIFAIVCSVMVVILGLRAGLFDTSKTVHANVVGFGAEIYWDQGCTNRTLSINWGSIEPGSNKAFTVYIGNEGDSAASLSMTTSNWAPSAALNYMTLNWNYFGQILSVSQVIPLEVILAVSPNVTGMTNFSFDITITTTTTN